MPKVYTIHKPTHKFFGPNGTPAIAIAQKRGDFLMINRLENGKVIDRAWAVGSCANHLTGYGKGVPHFNRELVARMRAAWLYAFGPDVPVPAWCEKHKES